MNDRKRKGVLLSACRSLLVLVLSFALVGLGIPTRSSAGGPIVAAATPDVYAEVRDEIYRLDLADYRANVSSVLHGSGSFTISVLKPELPGTVPGFDVGERPSTADVRLLGATVGEVATRTGIDLGRVRTWNEVISWTLSSTPRSLTSSFLVGDDRFSITVPRDVIEGHPQEGDAVDLEVNGFLVRVDPLDFYKLKNHAQRIGGPLAEASLPAELRELPSKFHDASGFIGAYAGVALILQTAADNSVMKESCLSPCMSCAAAVLGWGVSLGTFILTCGGALMSGGVLGWACVLGFLGHQGANMVVVAGCLGCEACLHPPPPDPDPCPDPPDPPDPDPEPCPGCPDPS